MNPSAEVQCEVPFHDVDMMDIVWHGHYYKYFELARTKLYRDHDLDVPKLKAMGFPLPIIESHCRYIAPLRYGMMVTIRAELVEREFRLKIAYLIRDAVSGKRLAKGYTVQVVVETGTGKLCLVVPSELQDYFGGSV